MIEDKKEDLIKYYRNLYIESQDSLDEIVLKYQDEILGLRDACLSYEFCYIFQKSSYLDIHAHEQVLINSKNTRYNYLFAKFIPNANIKVHKQVAIDNKDTYYIQEFEKLKETIFKERVRKH